MCDAAGKQRCLNKAKLDWMRLTQFFILIIGRLIHTGFGVWENYEQKKRFFNLKVNY